MENISQLEDLLNQRLNIKCYLYTNKLQDKCYIAIDGNQTSHRNWEILYAQFYHLKEYLNHIGIEYHREWNTVENENQISISIKDMPILFGLLRLL